LAPELLLFFFESSPQGLLYSGDKMTRRGQSTVEYMLTMSVVSLAIIAIMLGFEALITTGTSDLSDELASTNLTTQGMQ
jgi:Flp pilus assembly pilin Flp